MKITCLSEDVFFQAATDPGPDDGRAVVVLIDLLAANRVIPDATRFNFCNFPIESFQKSWKHTELICCWIISFAVTAELCDATPPV